MNAGHKVTWNLSKVIETVYQVIMKQALATMIQAASKDMLAGRGLQRLSGLEVKSRALGTQNVTEPLQKAWMRARAQNGCACSICF